MTDTPEIKRIRAALEIVMTQRDDLKTVLTQLLKESRTYLEESEICMSDSDFELNGCLGNAHAELKVILFPLAKQSLASASSTHQPSHHFSPQPEARLEMTDKQIEATDAADHVARGVPIALLAWANLSDEETQEPWNAGYAAARAWVKMQLSAPLQPAAQPELTDNEIDTISDAVACDPRRPETDYWRLFARAVIAAHKAKKGAS